MVVCDPPLVIVSLVYIHTVKAKIYLGISKRMYPKYTDTLTLFPYYTKI